ncbi:lipid kinase [Nocardioides sp.]|uniref:lipid kinase n=1 Tax=Nocardioides sp. TaxID=35761 RepID=UPI003518925D
MVAVPLDARVALVVNTGSRRGAAALTRAAVRLREAGFAGVEVHPVRPGERLEEVLAAALAARPEVLVVGGGDGTMSAAAGLVAGTDTVLGVLPLGTANDLARTLRIPSDLEAAVRVLTTGRVVDIDLGRVDGRPYLNVASIGLSVAVTERLSARSKKVLGPLAYPVATARAYRAHVPFAARLEFPDGDHPTLEVQDLMQVAVGNGRHYGGGNTVAPDASIDDRVLDVYAIERGRWRDHVSIAGLLRSGRFVEHERVHHLRTRQVRVVTDPSLPINLDGEIAATTPALFSQERNAVHVVLPADSDAAVLDGPAPHGWGDRPPGATS